MFVQSLFTEARVISNAFVFLLIAFFHLLPAQSPQLPGPHGVGTREVTFTDSSLATPTLTAKVYHPATSAGSNVPFPANGSYPVVAFGHGFVLSYLDYDRTCEHLASHGYVVINPDVQNGFNVSHLEFARELSACLRYVLGENADPNSDFYQHVDSLTGVYGHSMGGGASALVHTVFPDIDAVAGLAAAESNPSAIQALASYTGPFLTVSGTADNTTPEASNQQPMYNAVNGPKQWVSLQGAGHCGFTDGPTSCDFVSAAGSMSRDTMIYYGNGYITNFFDYFLKGKASAEDFICGDSVMSDASRGILVNTTNINCTAVSLDRPTHNWKLAMGSESWTIWGQGNIKIYDVQGRLVSQTAVAGRTQISTTGWQQGLYLIRTENGPTYKAFLLR